MEKKALGKGLDALLPDWRPRAVGGQGEVQQVPVGQILPNRFQPRTAFSEAELQELADSVRQNGMLQPVLLRRRGDGAYELIAGERRLRAAKQAAMDTIPAIVRNATDQQAMELALVENLQRKDLNPMEAARAYHRLLTEFGLTQEMIALRLGKERSSVANIVRLVCLSKELQLEVETGRLSAGHAKVLLGLDRPEAQRVLARRIIDEHLSVRQAETLASQLRTSHQPKGKPAAKKAFPDLEERLRKQLGTKVAILKGRRGGKIVLHYYSSDELDRLVETLLG
ncbi:MAG: ParB/RepB/Spo0J family partition protein [Nitrospirales bacterium]